MGIVSRFSLSLSLSVRFTPRPNPWSSFALLAHLPSFGKCTEETGEGGGDLTKATLTFIQIFVFNGNERMTIVQNFVMAFVALIQIRSKIGFQIHFLHPRTFQLYFPYFPLIYMYVVVNRNRFFAKTPKLKQFLFKNQNRNAAKTVIWLKLYYFCRNIWPKQQYFRRNKDISAEIAVSAEPKTGKN